MSLVNIKEVHLVPQERIHQSVKAFRRQQWLFKVLDEQHSDVLQKKIFSYFNISCFFLPPTGPVTTQTQALFVPGLTRAPTLSLDLLSAAGQGDFLFFLNELFNLQFCMSLTFV